MQNPKHCAIMLVVKLVRLTGMSLFDACRAAAEYHHVDYDWLYREMTE